MPFHYTKKQSKCHERGWISINLAVNHPNLSTTRNTVFGLYKTEFQRVEIRRILRFFVTEENRGHALNGNELFLVFCRIIFDAFDGYQNRIGEGGLFYAGIVFFPASTVWF